MTTKEQAVFNMRWKNKDGLEICIYCQHPAGEHYAEWGTKMESIGLMPSKTGAVGGAKTGQQMTHYIIDSGLFAGAAADLLVVSQFASQDSKFTLD